MTRPRRIMDHVSPGNLFARRSGVLVDWNDARGFGFITSAAGKRRVFVHVSVFASGRRPVAGCEVTYTEVRDERGRPSASAAEYVRSVRTSRARTGGVRRALTIVVPFLALVGGLVTLEKLPVWVFAAYGLASAAAVLTYAADKAAAGQRRQRTPESTLHLIALVGGWPGALVAQPAFRHKTIKQPFRTIFWITVVANCTALAWMVLGMPLTLA